MSLKNYKVRREVTAMYTFEITASGKGDAFNKARELPLKECEEYEILEDDIYEVEENDRYMSYKEAVSSFEEVYSDFLKQYRYDFPAKREAFNIYTDALCKEERISYQMYKEMNNPY